MQLSDQPSFQNNNLTENTDRVIMGPTDRTILESWTNIF